MLIMGEVAAYYDEVHELSVLLVEVMYLAAGLIEDANPKRFFPSDLEDRRLGSKGVPPGGNRQPSRSAVRTNLSTMPLVFCTHVA